MIRNTTMGSEALHAFAVNALQHVAAHDNVALALSCKTGNKALCGINTILDARDPKNIRPFIDKIKNSAKPFALVVTANKLVEVTRVLHALYKVKRTDTSVTALLQSSYDNPFHIQSAIKLWYDVLGIRAIEIRQGGTITRHPSFCTS